MAAELTKVDSAVAGLSISPKDEKAPDKKTHKRAGSQSEGIWNIKDLGERPSRMIRSSHDELILTASRGAEGRLGASD